MYLKKIYIYIPIRQYSSYQYREKYTENIISKRYEIPQTKASNTLWYFSSSFNALDILYIPCIAFVYFREDRLFLPLANIRRVSISRPAKRTLAEFIRLENLSNPSDMPFSKMFELAIGHWMTDLFQRASGLSRRKFQGNDCEPGEKRGNNDERKRETGLRKGAAKK